MKRITLKQETRRGQSSDKDLGYMVVSLENAVEPRVHTIISSSMVKRLIRHKYTVVIR